MSVHPLNNCMEGMISLIPMSCFQLWMGTHSRGPSRISHPEEFSNQLLYDWLGRNRWALGEGVNREYGGNELPFLFKVLSINRSLSIQAHPNKAHAEELHRDSPDLYQDPNHKPELAIAISHFEGFCGFRLFEEIRTFVEEVEELRGLVGEVFDMTNGDSNSVEGQRQVLRKAFTSLMECGEEMVVRKLAQLVGRVEAGDSSEFCHLCYVCRCVVYVCAHACVCACMQSG